MSQRIRPFILIVSALFFCLLLLVNSSSSHVGAAGGEHYTYMPIIFSPQPEMTEVRGLWVSRFDWTVYGQAASPAKIDEIVTNAAYAGFNTIYFQVRGTADAFYAPGLEPWAQRVSGGALGQAPNPFWDPLAYFVEAAHAENIQLHAYINVYPVWNCGDEPSATTTPTHLYHQLASEHGLTGELLNGLQWSTSNSIHCSAYQRGTPASIFLDDHFIAIGQDLINRYDIDGIHLDHIRYGGSTASCDPVSEGRYGADCFSDGNYANWQRQQVNGTVNRFYNDIAIQGSGTWLSAAVWPIYIDYWGWGGLEGYHDYYQDSKAWIGGGYIDSISPMIYPSSFNCPDNSFWTQTRWETLVNDFQASANGRFVIPGIGASYCTFDEIENRINAARAAGTAGHAIFSYSGLLTQGYFDDLANGPYQVPARIPEITWHPYGE